MNTTAGESGLGHSLETELLGHDLSEDDDLSNTSSLEEEEEDNSRRLPQEEMRDDDDGHNTRDHPPEQIAERKEAQAVEERAFPPETEVEALPSPASSVSGLDQTPSTPSLRKSSPGSSIVGSRISRRSGHNASPALTPFERRFKATISSSPSTPPRAISPAFLTAHSRQSSMSSQLTIRSQEDERQETDEERKPWEVIRWTKLRKITQQAFFESGRKAFGHPTYLCIGASIAIGTSKGFILLFDYQQVLKNIIGQGTAAAGCGSITSLAMSADHTTIAGGHANGSIFTWDLASSAKPFLQVPPISDEEVQSRPHEGHIEGRAILHVGFLGQRRTALVSADDCGMAFSHLATRGLGPVTRTIKTTRILGRYPVADSGSRKPSSVLAFAPLPLGNVEQATDSIGLTALLTPYLLVLISTTPIAQTQYKFPRPKEISAHNSIRGCLAWFPAVALKPSNAEKSSATSYTKLVFCWSDRLYILEVKEKPQDEEDATERQSEFEFKIKGRWTSDEAIVAVQWLSRSIIALLTRTQRLIILEGSELRIVESLDLVSKQIFHQDLFSRQLRPLVDKIVQGDGPLHEALPDAYHMSFKAYKGRLFLLGANDVSMGTLSNWADRLTAMLVVGKPIAAIELATSYYVGGEDKITVGLPEDDTRRHAIVKDKLLDLVSSSLEHIVNNETIRETEESLRTAFKDLARVSFVACAKLSEMDFLFDRLYEQYKELSMQDIFLYELEIYIMNGTISLVPPEVLLDILMWYEAYDLGQRLAEILCTLQPATMDIEQVTNVCRRMRLWDALIHVWNEAADDFVSPLVDLLSLIPLTTSPDDSDAPINSEDAAKVFPYLAYVLTGRSYPDATELSEQRASWAQVSVYSFLLSSKLQKWPPPDGDLLRIGNQDHELTYPYVRLLLDFDSFGLLTMLNEAFEDSFLNRDQSAMLNGNGSYEHVGVATNRRHIVNVLLEVVKPPQYDQRDVILLDIFLSRNLAKFYLEDILLPSSQLEQILTELCQNHQDDLREECQLSVEYLLTVYRPNDFDQLISLLEEAGFYRVLKSTYQRSKLYAKWLETHFRDSDEQEAVFDCISECLRAGSNLSKRQIESVKRVIHDHKDALVDINAARTAITLSLHAPDMIEDVLESIEEKSQVRFIFLRAIFEQKREIETGNNEFRQKYQDEYIELMCQHDHQHVSSYVTGLESGSLHLSRILPALERSGVIDAVVILLQHDGLAREGIDRLIRHLKFLQKALAGLLSNMDEDAPDDGNIAEALTDLLDQTERYVKLGIWLCQGEASKDRRTFKATQKINRAFLYDEKDLDPVELLWLDLLDAVISFAGCLPSLMPLENGHSNDRSTSFTPTIPKSISSTINATTTPIEKATRTLRDLVQTTFTAVLVSSSNTTQPLDTNSSSSTPQLTTDSRETNLSKVAAASSAASDSTTNINKTNLPRFPAILSTLLTRLSHSTALSSLNSTQQSTSTSSTSPSSIILPLLHNLLQSYSFESSILKLSHHFLSKDTFTLIAEVNTKRQRGWRPASRACEVCGRRCWGPGAGVGYWDIWARQTDLRGRTVEERKVIEEEEEREASRRRKGKGRAVVIAPSTDDEGDGDVGGVKANGKEGQQTTTKSSRNSKTERARREDNVLIDALVVFKCQHLFHKTCLDAVLGRIGGEDDEDGGASGNGNGDGDVGTFRYRCPKC